MLLLFIPLLVVSYFILSFATNQIFVKRLVSQFWGDVKNEAILVGTRLSGVFQAGGDCAKQISFDFNYNGMAEKMFSPNGYEAGMDRSWARNNRLYQYSYIFPEFDAVALIGLDSTLYATSYRISLGWNDEAFAEVQAFLDPGSIRDVWFPFVMRSYLFGYSDALPFTMGRRIIDIRSGSTICYLIINLSEEKICNIYSELDVKDVKSHYVVTPDGTILSASNKKLIATRLENSAILSYFDSQTVRQGEVTIDGEPMLVTAAPVSGPGLYLVSICRASHVKQTANQLSLIFLSVCLAVLAGVIFAVSFFFRRLTNSLRQLTDEMNKVQGGNFKTTLNIKSGDEIEYLANNFNIMLERMDNLFRQLVETEKQKRESQMRLMQSQIKPHFLYNALDLVYVLNSMGQTEKAMISVKALADFYRTALAGGEEIITIKEEIRNTENYLKLQKMRYSDVFDYSMETDVTIENFEIPKLTLQPLVENAIQHGLRCRNSKGRLSITGKPESDQIVIIVRDNGVGMSNAVLRQVRADMEGSVDHYGLCNTNNRLRLYFGEGYGLSIESEENKGTMVTIRLKAGRQHEK
jgi:two-component system sensor histidine kinase YesM